MCEGIPFEKGTYMVEQALLIAADHRAVALEDALIDVYQDHSGAKQVKGRGFVSNLLVVELLEDSDTLDLYVHLGGTFIYCLQNPDIVAGKVFSPGVKSVIQFAPIGPWRPVAVPAFENLVSRLDLLTA